ncbi:hypothetical protein JTE90_001415 [Oedothorax gibbosus]|uniref:Uncharacterized protein n=1 Tax=Oedothorax gibbosus TaxID=931172 RepID=A0AAV6VH26_9ARAC|nr:hypothetical protein JTE90_001415 [Oedothorax gibbosus]
MAEKQKVCSKRTRVKYLKNEEIQILPAQCDGGLSDMEDSDFENVIEDNTDENVIEALMGCCCGISKDTDMIRGSSVSRRSCYLGFYHGW